MRVVVEAAVLEVAMVAVMMMVEVEVWHCGRGGHYVTTTTTVISTTNNHPHIHRHNHHHHDVTPSQTPLSSQ